MRCVAAYERGRKVFLHASSRTTAGVWILSGSPVVCGTASAHELGECILKMLSESKEGVHHPAEWGNLFMPMLQLAGVKNYSAFAKSAKCVEVEVDESGATFTPTKNIGPDEGFVPLADKAIRIRSSEADALGNALLSGFHYAE